MIPSVNFQEQLVDLFPHSVHEMRFESDQLVQSMSKKLDALYAIKPEDRTFENTMLALDQTIGLFEAKRTLLYVTQLVNPKS